MLQRLRFYGEIKYRKFINNKNRIFKMMKTRGVEQGKSSILDNITSPSKNNRSDNSFETKSEGFDPKSFLS